MKIELSGRGFELVVEEKHQNERGEFTRLLQQSSAIGDYEDSMQKPGSSYLWVGDDHHLDREQIKEFIAILKNWLETGMLSGQGGA